MAAEKRPEPVRERITFLKVPIDTVPPDEFPEVICSQLNGEPFPTASNDADKMAQGKNIILLSLWDMLRARRNNAYREYILRSFLVIPISKSIIRGASFLKHNPPVRYMPFHFIINLLSVLESREYTLYLLGGDDRILRRVENNIHQTFPRLRIVGRHNASIGKKEEAVIIEAIRKTAPHLILVGRGVRGGEMWIARNHQRLGNGLRLWCSDIFDIFAEKRSRPSEGLFNIGFEALFYTIKNPLKFFRIIPYFRYKLLLLIYKISGRK